MILSNLPNLITVFLGIFLEASPFLLFGVLISSAIDVLVTPERLARWFPRNAVVGLIGGVALGAAAPLCECGTVPIARGSISKGLPLPSAIGFLLAAPVINPITVAATYTAFQNQPHIVILRMVLGVLIALAVGALFLLWPATRSPLRVTSPGTQADHRHDHDHDHSGSPGLGGRLSLTLQHTAQELSSLAVYLVAASLLAAVLQVFLPRQQLLSVGQGPLLSVVIMMAIAVALSTCSSVDAFVALAFSSTFAPGAILAFLLISPVLNLKSGALVVGLFKPQVAVPLFASASATILALTLAVNYHLI
jgi:uncharacterized membrane protein YraQ (UPF0718 family)